MNPTMWGALTLFAEAYRMVGSVGSRAIAVVL
jgi:hypothetical protein